MRKSVIRSVTIMFRLLSYLDEGSQNCAKWPPQLKYTDLFEAEVLS